jgi:hypothetical protein
MVEMKFNRRQRGGLADVLDKSAGASVAGIFVGLFVQHTLTVFNELLLLLIAVACVSLATWLRAGDEAIDEYTFIRLALLAVIVIGSVHVNTHRDDR